MTETKGVRKQFEDLLSGELAVTRATLHIFQFFDWELSAERKKNLNDALVILAHCAQEIYRERLAAVKQYDRKRKAAAR